MEIAGLSLLMIATGFGALFAFLAVIYTVIEGSPMKGVDTATTKMRGAILGAGTIVMMIAVAGVEIVMSAPELVITALGVGAIMAGFSWEVFGATALLTYVVSAAVRRGY